MTGDAWSERRRALEESFFHGRNEQLLNDLRQKLTNEETKKSLSAVSGIEDEQLLNQLVDAEISAETIAALALVPVIAVAWADGEIADKERSAILNAAEAEGISAGSVSHDLIECWLAEEPTTELLAAWKTYVTSLIEHLNQEAVDQIRAALVGRAERVAKAAGGILGLNRISPSEQSVLDQLAETLSG